MAVTGRIQHGTILGLVVVGVLVLASIPFLVITLVRYAGVVFAPPQPMDYVAPTSRLVLQKHKTLLGKPFAEITRIAVGRFTHGHGIETGVFSFSSAVFLDTHDSVRSKFGFPPCTMKPVDLPGDDSCSYLCCDLPVAKVLDHTGKVIWRYRRPGSTDDWLVKDISAGDLNGDGQHAFAISYSSFDVKHKDELHLVNPTGKLLWMRPLERIGFVEMQDIDGDGKPEILCQSGRTVIVWNSTGEQLFTKNILRDVPSNFLYRNPEGEWSVISADDNTIQLSALMRDHVTHCYLPKHGYLTSYRDDLTITMVRLNPRHQAYLAVLAHQEESDKDRTSLYIFDDRRALVYTEDFPDTYIALAAVPSGKSGAEDLLVGIHGGVMRYTFEKEVPLQ